MSGKSRHKAKPHSKKSKALQRSSAMPLQQQALVHSPKPATAASTSVPLERVPVEKVHSAHPPRAVSYPYVTSELKRIGILAGIMLAILIVLALVLS